MAEKAAPSMLSVFRESVVHVALGGVAIAQFFDAALSVLPRSVKLCEFLEPIR